MAGDPSASPDSESTRRWAASATTITALTFANGGEVVVNIYHGAMITFVNHRAWSRRPAICDFITFGRL